MNKLISVASAAFLFAALFAPMATAATFEFAGHARHGLFKEIRGTLAGRPLSLKLKRIQNVADVGGLLVEQNPSYEVTGESALGAVKLRMELEDQVATVGGIHVQTGTLTHVTGTIGARAFRLTIHEHDEIAQVGGISIQTGTWRELISEPTGAPAATLKAADGVHAFAGTDHGTAFSIEVHNWLTPTVTVSDGAAPELTVLLLALRPFLDVTH